MTEEQTKYRAIANAHLRKLLKPTTPEDADLYCRQAVSVNIPACTIAWLTMSDIIYDAVWWTCIDFGLDYQEYQIN